jgi:hypothetical protein
MKLARALAIVTIIVTNTTRGVAGPTALVQPDRGAMAVPGEPGIVIDHHAAPGHCSGTRLVARRTTARIVDAQLAAILLDAMPSPDISNAARTRFQAWVSRNSTRANAFGSTDVRDVARAIIALRFMAESLLRADIPASILHGEFADDATEAYCDTLGDISEPMMMRIETLLQRCAAASAVAGPGWWDEVCSKS